MIPIARRFIFVHWNCFGKTRLNLSERCSNGFEEKIDEDTNAAKKKSKRHVSLWRSTETISPECETASEQQLIYQPEKLAA